MRSAFVEMMVPHTVGVSECTIELGAGTASCESIGKGATAADLVGLSLALWDTAS